MSNKTSSWWRSNPMCRWMILVLFLSLWHILMESMGDTSFGWTLDKATRCPFSWCPFSMTHESGVESTRDATYMPESVLSNRRLLDAVGKGKDGFSDPVLKKSAADIESNSRAQVKAETTHEQETLPTLLFFAICKMFKSLFGHDDEPEANAGDEIGESSRKAGNDELPFVRDASLRIFTRQMKKQCWEKAALLLGRDPERWRLDPVGNVVCAKLTACDGCLCHEYDHIVPFSKGGTTTVENCQILQTRVNRFKGNQENDLVKLRGYSCDYVYSELELDTVEMSLYGDIKRTGRVCRCPSVMEQWESWKNQKMGKKQQQKDKIAPCKPITK